MSLTIKKTRIITNKDNLRFWGKVAITANPEKCWEWQGVISSKGYGKVGWQSKTSSAHRVAFEIYYGYKPILHILHSCDNRKCVNPNHLREGTPLENMRDAVERNRTAKGDKNGRSKLTEKDISAIEKLYAVDKISQGKIAEMFNICKETVKRVLHNRNWTHIPRNHKCKFNRVRMSKSNNPNGYKGVTRHKVDKKYHAAVYAHNKRFHCGSFNTPKEAARAYDKKAKELLGKSAYQNFPEQENIELSNNNFDKNEDLQRTNSIPRS